MNAADRAAFQAIAGHLAQGPLTAEELVARAEAEIAVAVKNELANMVKRGLISRKRSVFRLTAQGRQFSKGLERGEEPARRLVPDGPAGLQSQVWTSLRHFRAATPTQLLESFTAAIDQVTFANRRRRVIEYLETLAKVRIVTIDRSRAKVPHDFIARLVDDRGPRHPYWKQGRLFDPNAGTATVLDETRLRGKAHRATAPRAHRKAREAAR